MKTGRTNLNCSISFQGVCPKNSTRFLAQDQQNDRQCGRPQVDAFTERAFKGNSAAACLLSPQHLPLSDADRQLIAAEMNLAETAFVELMQPSGSFSGDSEFNLRWCVLHL